MNNNKKKWSIGKQGGEEKKKEKVLSIFLHGENDVLDLSLKEIHLETVAGVVPKPQG